SGHKKKELQVVGTVGQRNTGTTVRFWPDAKYFDSPRFTVAKLRHTLRAKAVLCPGLQITFTHEGAPEDDGAWLYEEGLAQYLVDELADCERLPSSPFVGHFKGADEEVDWAVVWVADPDADLVAESYVNLIATP